MDTIHALHLHYRLWIAELNADINVLRIFNDYLEEIAAHKNDIMATERVDGYKQQFIELRNEMDALRHEMHLNKMKLGAVAKNSEVIVSIIEKEIKHAAIMKRYKKFRKAFDIFKNDFQLFESTAII